MLLVSRDFLLPKKNGPLKKGPFKYFKSLTD